MTKHRSVVTGWDPDYENPDTSLGRPKGVQTAPDMRIATTYDVLAEGIFALKGVPSIIGSPTNSAQITPFMAAIAAPAGGFYVVQVSANETFSINMANVGAVKIYVQQKDYEENAADVDSEVEIGVVYGATAIPYNSLLLFTATITSETSTSGLTFTPAFKYTGAASGVVRVPTQADLANVAVLTTGIRALVTTTGGGGTKGEYFYGADSAWHETTIANPKLDAFLTSKINPDGSYKSNSIPSTSLILTKTVDANGWTKIDYGNLKRYKRRFSFSGVSIAAGGSTNLSNFFADKLFPVDISTVGTNTLRGAIVINSYAFAMNWNFEMGTTNTSLNVTAGNNTGTSRTFSGFLDVEFETQ